MNLPMLGIPELDEDHQNLFRVTAEFHLALEKGHLDVAYAHSRSLADAALRHVQKEESMLVGWSGRAEHAAGHQRLDTSLQLFFMRYPDLVSLTDPRAKGDLEAMAHYAESWLLYHIKFEDMQFVPFILDNGI